MPPDPDTITSFSNPLVKRLRALERKKARQESGLFLAEGMRLVAEGLERGWRAETVCVSASVADRPAVAALAGEAASAGARVVLMPDALIAKLTGKDNPGAVVAAFHQRLASLEHLAAGRDLWIALYEVRDPGNLGTIIRTADCAGLGGVILVGTCCDPFSVEAVRASMGSIFDVAVAPAGLDALLAWRNARGARIVAASLNADTRHDRHDMRGPTILLMGNEQAGLPQEAESACDALVRLPMRGGADSLNLAQASAILIYEAWRQRDFA